MKCTTEKLEKIFENWGNRYCLNDDDIKGLEVEISEQSAGKYRRGKIVKTFLSADNFYILVALNKPRKNEKNLKIAHLTRSQSKKWHFQTDKFFIRFLMKLTRTKGER